MTLQEHKDHLAYLEQLYSDNPSMMAIPKLEGAFYFSEDLSLAEHIEWYHAEINKMTGVN